MITSLLVVLLSFHYCTCLNVWPLPAQYKTGTSSVYLDNTITFQEGKLPCTEATIILHNAVKRYYELIFDRKLDPLPPNFCHHHVCISSIRIDFNDKATCEPLQLYNDETYQLIISDLDRKAVIKAGTVWGALRGLETFSQLINLTNIDNIQAYTIESAPINIIDAPRFPWRGFMLDTSRHYYNIGTILQTLDAMSYLKLNVFHFHIIDDESFPLVVPKRPLLHENAAYDKDLTYTPDDLTKIVSYANERGIRVVFETDIPGHAMSWQKGYPNIAAKCPGFHANVLDITKDETYDVIGDVMNLIVSVSLDSFYHIGGDEISQDCYEHDPSVVQFMKQHNISDVNHLVGYFVARVADMLAKRNKTMVCWHDLTNHKDAFRLPKDTIVEAWWALKNIGIIIDRGYRVINSAGWYLDYLNVGVWDMYTVEPYDGGNFTDAQKKMILGGEAPLWSEYVDDTNFNARVYPRLLAVAERLWSPQNIKDVTTALPRIDHMGCQIMLKRGIPVPPVQPGYCNKMKYKKPW